MCVRAWVRLFGTYMCVCLALISMYLYLGMNVCMCACWRVFTKSTVKKQNKVWHNQAYKQITMIC